MEAFMYRLHPSWVAVRELVASGRIGRLTAVQSWFSYFNDDPANIRNIREVGGGALYDVGCYNVNLSRMLFGAEPTHVSATHHARSGQRRRHDDERHPRVRVRGRDVHLLHPHRDRPAGPRLRHGGPHLHRHPVQHPARSPDRDLRDGRRRSARRPGDRDAHLRHGRSRTRSRPSGSPRRSWTARPSRSSRRTRSRTCGSSNGSSRPPSGADPRRPAWPFPPSAGRLRGRCASIAPAVLGPSSALATSLEDTVVPDSPAAPDAATPAGPAARTPDAPGMADRPRRSCSWSSSSAARSRSPVEADPGALGPPHFVDDAPHVRPRCTPTRANTPTWSVVASPPSTATTTACPTSTSPAARHPPSCSGT